MTTSNGQADRSVRSGFDMRILSTSTDYDNSDVASANSTMSTMGTFLMAMIKNPEVQVKAQAEIDRVIGMERLPTIAE